MSADIPPTDVYTDFQGLTRLRLQATDGSPEALKEAAKQFEALFLQMMLKSMRDASLGDPLFDSDQGDFYREMYDQQLTLSLANGRGVGLAEVIEGQLGAPGSGPRLPIEELVDYRAQALPPVGARREPEPPAPLEAPRLQGEPQFSTPAEFVTALWPHAARAGQALGVDPRALIAQAALETGWGQKVIRQGDGGSSFNFFNIKADGRWSGERVVVSTIEHVNGVASRTRAGFRAYESVEQAFGDYVAFVKTNPRYAEALRRSGDPGAYIDALHAAGYATDPSYSQKINRIRESLEQMAAVTGIKDS